MRVGVIVFPGSNCDHDAYHVARHVFGLETTFIWHKERELPPVDLVIVPGGFSYGDYLRAGAVARFSLIMDSVVRFAEHGGLVLGICNGFQVLCECGLLPGALLRNASVRFACTWVHLRIDNTDVPYTRNAELGQVLFRQRLSTGLSARAAVRRRSGMLLSRGGGWRSRSGFPVPS